MMRHPLKATLLAVILTGLVPSYAAAQRGERNEAREAFRAGERAFEENDNEAALELFRRAFELAPNDVVRFNIAVCLERLGRHREAALEYDSAAESEVLSDADRDRAAASAARARARLGTLVVEGDFGGHDVMVDGEVLCTMPCEVLVDPGRHEVSVERGETAVSRSASVDRGGRSLVTLEEPRAETQTTETAEGSDEIDDTERSDASTAGSSGGATQGPGFLTWTGAGLAAVGAAGIIYFGLRAQSIHDQYVLQPTTGRRDKGMLYRDLANISIGVAGLGAVLLLVDLLFLAPQSTGEEERAVSLGFGDVRVRF